MTPLGPLAGDALRRALVEPAQRERLPLRGRGAGRRDGAGRWRESGARCRSWPSRVSQLWERRDRERKLLTRAAYEEIGGVAGALAQHAEATLERIGAERQAIVREIFRNLVTAQGTRAACGARGAAVGLPGRARRPRRCCGALVDARLLTSLRGRRGRRASRATTGSRSCTSRCSRPGRGSCAGRRRTRRARCCATSSSRRRTCGRRRDGRADLLWTGTSYREYELWRERYPGALTALEEDFAQGDGGAGAAAEAAPAPSWLAAIVAAALVVAVVIGVLWRRSEAARAAQARAEALRAEAGKLLALGRSELERYPTAALAYARKSLELPTPPRRAGSRSRRCGAGPVRVLPMASEAQHWVPDFSPDGEWLATAGPVETVSLFRADGTLARTIRGLEVTADPRGVKFDVSSRRLVTAT